MTDFWARQNKLSDFKVSIRLNTVLFSIKDLEVLAKLPKLDTVCLEMNPWSETTNYRNIVVHTLTNLKCLDSEICRQDALANLDNDKAPSEQEVQIVQ